MDLDSENKDIISEPQLSRRPISIRRIMTSVGLALLFVSPEIIGVLFYVGFSDDAEYFHQAAWMAMVVALPLTLLIVAGANIIWPKKQTKKRLVFVPITIAVSALVLFPIAFFSLSMPLDSYYGYKANAPERVIQQQVSQLAKIRASADTLVFTADHQPIGIHVEAALEIPESLASSASYISPSLSFIISGPLVNSKTLEADTSGYYMGSKGVVAPYLISPNIKPTESGTIIQYVSYDIFPFNVKFKNASEINNTTNAVQSFCIDGTDFTPPADTSTFLSVAYFLEYPAYIETTTMNKYNFYSFYQTVQKEGLHC